MSIYPYLEASRKRVEDNKKKLDSCTYHEFVEIEKGDSCMQLQVVCKHCEGRLNKDNALWYSIGYKDGREKNEKEIKEKA